MTAALTPSSVGGVACLAIALGALAFAAGRLASLVSPAGGERLLASAAVVGTLAVGQSLALGLAGLGTSRAALSAVSLAIGVLAAVALPRPAVPFGEDLRARWEAVAAPGRVAAGAALGVALAWAGFALLRPSLDLDSAYYNLPQIAGWVANGKPGSIELISFYYPIGNYQLTNEVLSTWFGSISGNLGFVLLWPVAAAGLLLGGTYTTLRALACEVRIAVGAALIVLLIPIVAESLTSFDSDLPSIAWAAVAVALCTRVATGRGSPDLIPFAILALGLAIGTKTTVAPIGLAALIIALIAAPRRPRLAPVLAALAAAVAIGGAWYLRNFIDHGSPLWPFATLPGSDPLPETLDKLSAPFIGSPIDTLENRVDDYFFRLGAGILLVASAIVLPLLTKARGLKLAAGGVALSLMLWMVAPATGEPPEADAEIFQVSGARYLMATILLAIGVLAVVGSRSGRAALAARAVLVVALGWGLVNLAVGRDGVPPGWLLLLGAVAGAAVALLGGVRPLRVAIAALAVAFAVAGGLALAAYPDRFLVRFAAYADSVEDPLEDASATYADLAEWFQGQPDFVEGSDPVYFSDVLVGPLTGGRLAHELVLIRPEASCAEVDDLPSGAWTVVGVPASRVAPPIADCFAASELQLELDTPGGGAFRVYRSGG